MHSYPMTTDATVPPPTEMLLKAPGPNSHSARFDVMRVGACLAVILLHLAATLVMERELFGSIHWHISNAIDAATR